MKLIRSISGIRGIIGENFSPTIAAEYAKSFCSIQSGSNPIIIARDTRNQGYEISQDIKDTVISLGRDVYDIGIAPTPVIQHLVKKLSVIFFTIDVDNKDISVTAQRFLKCLYAIESL